ncbi:MAG: hypothetical protein QOC81_4139 [Thermoanaerobaculia bacterium]|jgi:hypothetical protein|nr:hypothetical protein [Thermoanaerobaculia bacterium]
MTDSRRFAFALIAACVAGLAAPAGAQLSKPVMLLNVPEVAECSGIVLTQDLVEIANSAQEDPIATFERWRIEHRSMMEAFPAIECESKLWRAIQRAKGLGNFATVPRASEGLRLTPPDPEAERLIQALLFGPSSASIGTNILPAGGVEKYQGETQIMVNPNNDQQLIAGANTFYRDPAAACQSPTGGTSGTLGTQALYGSSDGGLTWTYRCAPWPSALTGSVTGAVYWFGSDPAIAWDAFGRAYAAYMLINTNNAQSNAKVGFSIVVARSSDVGNSWQSLGTVVDHLNDPNHSDDKEMIAIDNSPGPASAISHPGRIYVVWDDKNVERIAHSDDGASWTTVVLPQGAVTAAVPSAKNSALLPGKTDRPVMGPAVPSGANLPPGGEWKRTQRSDGETWTYTFNIEPSRSADSLINRREPHVDIPPALVPETPDLQHDADRTGSSSTQAGKTLNAAALQPLSASLTSGESLSVQRVQEAQPQTAVVSGDAGSGSAQQETIAELPVAGSPILQRPVSESDPPRPSTESGGPAGSYVVRFDAASDPLPPELASHGGTHGWIPVELDARGAALVRNLGLPYRRVRHQSLPGLPAAKGSTASPAGSVPFVATLLAPSPLVASDNQGRGLTAFDVNLEGFDTNRQLGSIRVSLKLKHPHLDQLTVWLVAGDREITLWDGWGGSDDGGYDDGDTIDSSIVLDRFFDQELKGQPPHWTLYISNADQASGVLEHAWIVATPAAPDAPKAPETPSATLDIVAQRAYLRTAASNGGVEVSQPTVGQTVYFYLDWQVTGSGSSVTTTDRALLDGSTYCSGSQLAAPGSAWNGWCNSGWVATAGTHTLQWDLDYNNAVSETNESNNSATKTLSAAGLDIVAQRAYLRTAASNGGIEVAQPSVGQTVYFYLDWQVTGSGNSVTVSDRALLDGSTYCSGSQAAAPGTSWNGWCNAGWVATAGTHTLQWDLDYNNAVSETNESNNSASKALSASGLDIVAQRAYLRTAASNGGVEVDQPTVGQTVYFYMDWQVTGSGSSITATNRALLDGSTYCSGSQLAAPGSSWNGWCSTGWTATAGTHTLQWDLDYNNAVAETNENNNSAAKTLSGSGLDIAAQRAYLRTAVSNGGTEVDQPTVGQTVYFYMDWQVTGSGSSITATIRALLDGSAYCSGSQLAAPGSAWNWWCNAGWTAAAGTHTLQWDLDYNNSVAETNENNNSASKALTPSEQATGDDIGGNVVVGADGTVYVIWNRLTPEKIVFSKSVDGGNTWSSPVAVASMALGSFGPNNDLPAQNDRGINAFGSLGIDSNPASSYFGTLYVAFNDFPAGTTSGTDLNTYVARSSNGGASWSARVKVNDDTGTATQLFPWLSVDQTDGSVNVSWYDTRADANNRKTQVYYARSSNGGVSFEPNIRITDSGSAFRNNVSYSNESSTDNASSNGNQYGDYAGVVAANRVVHPFWVDSRNFFPVADTTSPSRAEDVSSAAIVNCSSPAQVASPGVSTSCPTTGVQVSWTAPSGWGTNATSGTYSVYRSTTASFPNGSPLVSGLTSTSFNDSSGVSGTTYFYFIAARNNCPGTTLTPMTRASAASVGVLYPSCGLAAPTSLVARATSSATVDLTWVNSVGAVSYQIQRSSGTGFSTIGTATGPAFTDNPPGADTAYLYVVRAVDSGANVSPASNRDLATTVIFSNDPLQAGVSRVNASHLTQLRQAVGAVRSLALLQPYDFVDPTITVGSTIRAAHVRDLRTALDQARASLGLPALSYSDSTLTEGRSSIRAVHVQQLRDGVK